MTASTIPDMARKKYSEMTHEERVERNLEKIAGSTSNASVAAWMIIILFVLGSLASLIT